MARLGGVVAVSPLYETAPIGGPDQGPYLNAVAVLDTPLSAAGLLRGCLAIERSRGRERRERWGPRTLDLDLLLYGNAVLNQPGLRVPHPRLGERRFVLQPLADAWPGAVLPNGTPVAALLGRVAGQQATRVPGERWWESGTAAGVLETPSPEVSTDQAAALAATLFGIDGEAAPLPGERDRNFVLVAAPGRFSLKVANPSQDPALLDMQQTALQYLAGADPGLPIPRVIPASDGAAVGLGEVGGTPVLVRMLTHLDGAPLPDGHSTPACRDSLATLLVRLDTALAGFSHPGGARANPWDLTRLALLRERTVYLSDERRGTIVTEIDRFEGFVLPALRSVGWQMIHADANPANLLTDSGNPDRVTGIVDFGDLMEGPLVAEIAIAAAYQCLGRPDPAEVVADLITAYHRRLPLRPEEIALVPSLVVARLVQSHVISAWRASLHPGNRGYILIHAEPVWEALERMRQLPDGWLEREMAG